MAKIAVYGAGAVGCYYGGRLEAAGHEVTFIARGAQLQALRSRGLQINSYLGDLSLTTVHAAERLPADDYDAILVCVKAHDTAAIVTDIRQNSGENSLIVSLQNGVENEGLLAHTFGAERVVGAAAFITAEVTAPGVVTHAAAGHVVMGPLVEASRARVAELVQWFKDASIEIGLSEDIRVDLWTKLCWNAAFNSTTAATGTTAKIVLEADGGEALIRALMEEVIAVARAEGVAVDPHIVDRYVYVTKNLGEVRTSMLVDRERGRKMEHAAINGAVVRHGAKHGIPTPTNLSMYVLLQAMERGKG